MLVLSLRDQSIFVPCGKLDPPTGRQLTSFCERLAVNLQAEVYLPARKTNFALWRDCNWFLSLQQQNALGTLYTINITELVEQILTTGKKRRKTTIKIARKYFQWKLNIQSGSTELACRRAYVHVSPHCRNYM